MPGDSSKSEIMPSLKGLGSYLVIWGFAALLLLSSWSAITYKISVERETEIAQIYRNNSNLARVFEEHTIRTIQSVDQAILFLSRRWTAWRPRAGYASYRSMERRRFWR